MENLVSFFEKNSIYIVLFIVLVIWIGIFLFVNSTDKRLKSIEKELKEK
ncbi:MAG: CcmD family protein [Ignavibacteriales bacterium CG_4_9_14_3_um_filter_34_10]|nr:MAG: CcmD family protein [Ignavibacteriales bacterium CG_4_9_14_3_um_filter_34_10]